MGQKINQKIFRVGFKDNNWNFIYNSLNDKYTTNYFIKNIYICDILTIFFYSFNIVLSNVNIVYNKNAITAQLKLYNLYFYSKNFLFTYAYSKKKNEWFLTFINVNSYKFYFFLIKKISLFILKYLKKKKLTFLTSFVKEKNNIKLNTSYQQSSYLKLKLQLKKYLFVPFFKECFCILTTIVKLKDFSKLLAFYLKLEFTKLKKHNFFLTFLKRALIFFVYSSFSKIKGVKILVKGRLNGRPRAGKKLIQVGRISSQSFDSKISSTKVTSFTSLGTFGINVWICES